VLSGSQFDNIIEILPVTPWGKFVPALNCLLRHAKAEFNADLIMFVSAEVNASSSTVKTLCEHVVTDSNVIVAGAAMNGHEYAGAGKLVPLTGRYVDAHHQVSIDVISFTTFHSFASSCLCVHEIP
jgi:hypothetical protein